MWHATVLHEMVEGSEEYVKRLPGVCRGISGSWMLSRCVLTGSGAGRMMGNVITERYSEGTGYV